MNVKTKEQLVLQAIKNNPEAANDDAILLAECWSIELEDKSIHVTPTQLLGFIKYTSRPESITRRRRELFNEGKIVYSDKAQKTRMKAFVSERDMHSNFIPRKVMPW